MKENKKKWVMSLFREKEETHEKLEKNKNSAKKNYFLRLFRQ